MALFLTAFTAATFGSDISQDAQSIRQSLTGRMRKNFANASEDWGELGAAVSRILHEADSDAPPLLQRLRALQDDRNSTSQRLSDLVRGLMITSLPSGVSLAWTWSLLAKQPESLSRVRAELASAIGDRRPDSSDIDSLPYLRACHFEAIRLLPPSWVVRRRTTQSIHLGEWTVPEDSTIWAPAYALQRDARYWTEPKSYNPERWLCADGSFSYRAPGQPLGAFLAFGLGRRKCIGETFDWIASVLILATILQRWDAKAVSVEPVALEPGPTVLRPKGGLPMEVSLRA